MCDFEKNSTTFRLLAEAVSEGIIVVNEEQEIVVANTWANDMFGYDDKELVGKSLEVLIPKTSRKVRQKYIEGYSRKHEKRRMALGRSLFGVRKNQEQFPLEVGLNPFSLDGHTYVMALVIDIRERKKIEENHNMRTASLDAALNGVTITDALQTDHPIIYANAAFKRMVLYKLPLTMQTVFELATEHQFTLEEITFIRNQSLEKVRQLL